MAGNLFLFLPSILGCLPINISSFLEIFSKTAVEKFCKTPSKAPNYLIQCY